MMRKNVYLIVWLMTVILYSCYDDKGNYSYEDIDEICRNAGHTGDGI